jgi:hypothetical protein
MHNDATTAPTPRKLHASTFQYLKPTDAQKDAMLAVRGATADYAQVLQEFLPEGPDKTYLMRKVREVGMWANVAITREADGTPRDGATTE